MKRRQPRTRRAKRTILIGTRPNPNATLKKPEQDDGAHRPAAHRCKRARCVWWSASQGRAERAGGAPARGGRQSGIHRDRQTRTHLLSVNARVPFPIAPAARSRTAAGHAAAIVLRRPHRDGRAVVSHEAPGEHAAVQGAPRGLFLPPNRFVRAHASAPRVRTRTHAHHRHADVSGARTHAHPHMRTGKGSLRCVASAF